jgi:hypothetical protein
MRTILSSLVLLAVSCTLPVAAPPAPPAPLVPFDPAEVAWAKGSETATIEGQAFLKTRGGDVKYGAGNDVLLFPYSAQSFDFYRRAVAGEDPPRLDPALSALSRAMKAGGDGSFRFDNLPAGSYLLLTSVTWEAPVGYQGAMRTQGGALGAPATAENGKTTRIIITRRADRYRFRYPFVPTWDDVNIGELRDRRLCRATTRAKDLHPITPIDRM